MSKLSLIEIDTTLGASYSFPEMDGAIFEKILGNEEMWRRLGSLALTNASGACLVVPTRVIQTIKVDNEVRWTASPV